MADFFAQVLTLSEQLVQRIRSAPYQAPSLITIRSDAYTPAEAIGEKIRKDNAYFSIRVNELFLKDGRSFLETYDPMLLVMTEFLHGGKKVTIPFVVGAELLKLPSALQSIGSVRFNDILVCGPHPFRGGNVAVSVFLYKVQRDNYAKDFLRFVEGVSSSVGVTANVELLTKIGGSLVDGLETLLKTKGVVPIMGHRIEFDTTGIDGLSSAAFLLTSADSVDEASLRVTNGRLMVVPNADAAPRNFQDADYVLYTLSRVQRRNDESSLPFYPMRDKALEAVLSGDEGWKRAKATLLALYQEMITSKDLVKPETDELFERYKSELLEARAVLKSTDMLSTKDDTMSSDRAKLNEASAGLDRL